MATDTTTLTFTQQIEAEPTAVYNAFTDARLIRQWLCNHAQLDPRPGGRLYLYFQDGFYAAGEFTELASAEKLEFTWQGRQEPFVTTVAVMVTAVAAGTQIDLHHRDVPTAEEWEPLRRGLTQGWETGLANLKSVLETGLDRRIFDQPFLGILISGVLSAEQAAAAGLPIAGGVSISGTAEGTGTAAAGLENGDILINLGGTETPDMRGLRAALRPFKAGETIKVSFFRDGEKQSAMMTLSQRPTPDIPPTPSAFAETLQDTYAQLDQELDALLDGVTDEIAATPPADGEWSVMDVLAHLIGTERMMQVGLAAQVGGGVVDGYPNNSDAWNRSITAVYPTLDAITAAWKRTEAETVALVSALTPEFVAHKIDMLNLTTNLLQGLPGHTRGHFEQMRAAVAAATAAAQPEPDLVTK